MSMAPYRPFAFLAVSIAWTWGSWLALATSGLDPWAGGQWLIYLGGLGPLVVAFWLQHRHSAGRGLQDFWQRLVQPGRAPLWLWVAALGLVPVLSLSAHAILMLGGGPAPSFTLPGGAWPAAMAFAAFIFLLGPLPEEIGWRGYGLDALLTRLSPLAASGILGGAWGVWHLPLFVLGGYYAPFGGPPVLWLFLWSILMTTVIMTWGYLASDRSLLLMVVFHFMVNFTGEVIPMPPDSETVFRGLLTAVGALAAYRLWRIRQE